MAGRCATLDKERIAEPICRMARDASADERSLAAWHYLNVF